MAGSDLLIRIDGTSSGFDAAASAAAKASLRLETALKSAATAQTQLNAATAEFGASSSEATTANKAYEASLAKVARAQEVSALASKRAAEQQVAGAKAAAAAQEQAAARQSAALKKVGNAYGLVGLAAGAALVGAAKAAADFNAKMAQVQSLSKASAGTVQRLADATKHYADLGVSASDAADAEIELVKAGISAKDILGGALTGALNLAAAGQIDVGQATSIAAQAMTQFQLKGKDIPHVADLLAAGADKALGSVQDLGDGLKYAGLTAHQLGIPIGDTVAALSEFAQAGLIGQQGGSAFQQMLLRLENPTAKSAALMQQYKISLYDASGQFVGMSSLAGQLHDKLGTLTQQQRLSALATLFGSRAVRAANVLYQDGSKGVDAWQQKVQQAGFASEQAHGKMDSLNGDLDKLKASAQNLAIDFGQNLQGPLRGVTQDITGLLNVVGGLPDPIKKGAVELLALTTAVGAGVFVYSKAKIALASMGKTLGVVTTEETAAGTAANLTNTKMLAMRGGAALAGIALLSLQGSAAKASQGLGQTVGVLGDAALGFSVGGPWGAAIGAGVGLFQALTDKSGSVVTGLDGITASLDKNTGAWTRNTTAQANQISAHLGTALDALGVSTNTFSQALHGNARAQVEVGVAAQKNPLLGGLVLKVMDQTNSKIKQQQDYLSRLAEMQTAHSTPAQVAATNATRAMGGSMLDTAGNVQQYQQNVDKTTTSTQGAAKATQDLITKVNALDNKALTQRQGFRDWQQAIDDATAALVSNGKTLDINTQKGRDNSAALDAVASSALGAEKNMQGAALVKFNNDAHDKLVALAESFGMSTTAAQNYADRVLHTMNPASDQAKAHLDDVTQSAKNLGQQQPNVKVTAETADATRGIDALTQHIQTSINSIHGETVPLVLSAQAAKVASQLSNGSNLPGFDSGGPVVGPGTGKSDSIIARLSNGEHIITADEVAAAGGHKVIEAIRRMLRRHEMAKLGDIPAFAEGGPVVSPAISPEISGTGLTSAINAVQSTFDAVASSLGSALSSKANNYLTHLPTQGQLGPGGMLTPAQIVRGQDFAAAQVGKPYVWGGVGPSGYDCSGYQSAILNYAMGMYPYSRRGSTYTMPWAGSAPGVGRYTIGWENYDGIGHTAGNIGGMNVESYGGHGPAVGSGARGPLDSLFDHVMHYDVGGRLSPGWTASFNGLGHDETVLPYPPEAIAKAMRAVGVFGGGGIDKAMVGAMNAVCAEVAQLRAQVARGTRVTNANEIATGVRGVARDEVDQAASYNGSLAGLNS